ncbi:asparagine synthase (glutamine-hydrolyzing) [Aquibium microcysteis]|uniref:asparagine synthase (glutamine-hydrolyzing) n=1 Tax=Aquibium microcysteis TaxID=675281 RepID=UPI00165D22A9|nr:asparagine synthase (glutamine-hydrolyzing) [Aquibium microcysteis]
MCGIAGVWRFAERTQDVDDDDVRTMIAAIRHRGPDGEGYWSGDSLMLGHCRLAIIDTSDRGLQPAVTADGSGVLAYNGEVYNFRELRRELEDAGGRFLSGTDTEVVLRALHEWGVETAVRRFTGMFAFAYFDRRERVLWLCRDRLGIKGLSVVRRGDRLLFASEDKALLRASGVGTRIDTRTVTLSLALQDVDAHLSSFADVRRLPPGACWRVDGEGIREGSFWNALAAIETERLGDRHRPVAEAKVELENLLRASVGLHCVSDVRLATACSSGVDSGLVTALSREFVDPFHAYVVAPDTGVSEAQGAQRTCDRLRVPLQRVGFDRETYLRNLATAIYHVENGNLSNSTAALLAMTRQCRQDGVKVLLTGEGSDELFGGYGWHAVSAGRARWANVLAAFGPTRRARERRRRRIATMPFANAFAGSGTVEHRILSASLFAQHILAPEAILEALSTVSPVYAQVFAGNGIFDLYGHMGCIIHRHDRISMASSVELRVPFLENAVIDFALNLHPDFKRRQGRGKWLLKEVASKYLPRENILARKKGFPVSSDYFAGTESTLRSGALRDLMAWSRAETERIVGLCAADGAMRTRLVGHEIFGRIYGWGVSPEQTGEALVAAAAERGAVG